MVRELIFILDYVQHDIQQIEIYVPSAPLTAKNAPFLYKVTFSSFFFSSFSGTKGISSKGD